VKWRKKNVAVYMYLFLDLSLVRKKKRSSEKRGGGNWREKKWKKEKKKYIFLKEVCEKKKKTITNIFSYRSELEEKW